MKSGISFQQFAEAAKLAFVEQALSENESRGRKTNVSRVAARTGLSRKDVSRIRRLIETKPDSFGDFYGDSSRSGNAARVLQLWHSEPEYLGSDGRPIDLLIKSVEPDFHSLVRLSGGDVPLGAIRAELLASGAVEELPSGRLRALKRVFIPSDVMEEIVVGLTHIVRPVMEGIDHNSSRTKDGPFFQRLAYSDQLTKEAIPHFRKIATERSAEFIQSTDDWLASTEMPPAASKSRHVRRVAVGVFYYEGDVPHGRTEDSEQETG